MASTIFLSFTLPRSSSPFLSILHRRLHSCITVARRLTTSKTPRPLASLRFLRAVTPPPWSRFNASFASCGGGGGRDGFGGGDGGDHGGGDGPDGGYVKVGDVGGAADDVSAFSPEVIVLDVGGMTCGGCAASVKRILESQPQVSSATVNLATETAIVWPVFEAKVSPDWQGQLGELLANHLTACGFKSNLRGQGPKEEDIS